MVFANETARGDAPNSGGGEPRLEAPQPASARIGISAVAPVHLWTAGVQDDALAPSDVEDADDTDWHRRGPAEELGRAMKLRGFDQPVIEKVCFE
jgi:hypothetical protein